MSDDEMRDETAFDDEAEDEAEDEAVSGFDSEADEPVFDGEGSFAEERESPFMLLRRGETLMRNRHYAQAAVILERAARIETGKGSILEALGRALYNSGQHERAAEVFTELLEVDPSGHYAHFALGLSLHRLGQPERGRTHLRLAVALAPESALYRRTLERYAA
jgi:tetratricopeptide (TPR) repeat protein